MLDKPAPTSTTRTSGPLAGFRIVEFAGIGPGPFACMMLADMGAEVVTLDRVGAKKNMKSVAGRGRKVVELDLKDKAAVAQVLDLLANADALIEGFRPGVMERLGLGPDVVQARNPRLVYGRMTGWGQSGPLAMSAGHDLNYIALAGAYKHGELGLTYPIMRGFAPLLVALGSATIVGEVPTPAAWLGVIGVTVGVVLGVGDGVAVGGDTNAVPGDPRSPSEPGQGVCATTHTASPSRLTRCKEAPVGAGRPRSSPHTTRSTSLPPGVRKNSSSAALANSRFIRFSDSANSDRPARA